MCLKQSELPQLVAVSGGIGSGKSVICRILRLKGFRVYDCDSRAKRLMDSDSDIKQALFDEITPLALRPDGTIDRKAIAAEVFADPAKLRRLNSIVHGAVLGDITAWYRRHIGDGKILFVETAILYQSGLDRLVSEVWEVTAPEEIRLRRAMRRDSADERSVRARIAAQCFSPATHHHNTRLIVNDDTHPVLPQLNRLLPR